MSQLMISAAHKSSGKTTVSIGLCAALKNKGLIIQPFKKGPDYIDPLWLGQAANQACINLDFYTMGREEIQGIFNDRAGAAQFSIVEGNKGLYDGLDLDGSNSNAALAAQLGTPVVLVLDTRGMTRGVAPLVLGYQAFDPDIRIAGVILNKVGGARHESKLRNVIEHYTDVPVIGAVGASRDMHLPERHLGLMPSNEIDSAQGHIDRIGQLVADQVDLDRVLEAGGGINATPVPWAKPEIPEATLRIAYAKDEAFGFYYADDLEKFRGAAVELVAFDALHDARLPEVDGLFIGGGFPETRLDELADNHSLINDIRTFIEQGGPAYAECGGLMYLCRSLTWEENQRKMVGVIDADAVMYPRPQGRGYGRLREATSHPWSGLKTAAALSAHEFHYSGLESIASDTVFAYQVERGHGVDGQHDGIVYKNLLANYMHLRDAGENHWVTRFVDHVRKCKQNREG